MARLPSANTTAPSPPLPKAGDLAPEFALTKWKLGLFYEAMGNIDQARENFTRYQQLTSDQSGQRRSRPYISPRWNAKRAKYDEEVDEAEDIVADLFNRSMKLTFNGSEKRSAMRAKRAQVKKKEEESCQVTAWAALPFLLRTRNNSWRGRVSIFRSPRSLSPWAPKPIKLMGLVFLQANDGHSADQEFRCGGQPGLAGCVLCRDARPQAGPGGEVRIESRPCPPDLPVVL